MKLFVVVALVIIAIQYAGAQESSPAPTPRLLMIHPVEASATADGEVKELWFSAITEAYYRLRFQPVGKLDVVGPDTLFRRIPELGDLGRPLSEDRTNAAAAKYKVTHLFTQKYEVSVKGTVYYYAELFQGNQKNAIMTFEKEFPLEKLGEHLDACASEILKKIGVTPSIQAGRIIRIPLLGASVENMKGTGGALAEAFRTKGAPGVKSADALKGAVDRDNRMAVASFAGAQIYASLGSYGPAAQLLNTLITKNGFSYASLYSEAARCYRLDKQLGEALRMITLAEKEGFADSKLMAEKAGVFEKNGKTAEAKALYVRLVATEPNNPDALLFLAVQNNKEGDFQTALNQTERLLKQNVMIPAATLAKGKALAGLKQFALAEKALLSAAQLLPQNPEPNMVLGTMFRSQKEYMKAAGALEKVLAVRPDDADLLLDIVECYMLAKSPSNAIAVLTPSLGRFAGNKTVLKKAGLIEFQLKDSVNARKHLEAAVMPSETDGEMLRILADLYAAMGDGARAITNYEAALPLTESKTTIRLALARLYLGARDPKKAQAQVTVILAREPSCPGANRYLGDALRAQGDPAGALAAYKKERTLGGADAHLQEQIASTSYELGDHTAAYAEYQKVAAANPKNGEAQFRLAVSALKLKKADEANGYLKQAEKLGKGDKGIYCDFGRAYAEAASYEKSIAAYKTCIAGVTPDEATLLQLAAVYDKAQKDADAAATWQRVYELDPAKNLSWLAKAGHVFYKLGQKSPAAAAYAKLIDKAYADPQVNVNSARMEFEQKNFTRVIALLKDLAPPVSQEEGVIGMLANSYSQTGQFALAVKYNGLLLAKNPANVEAVEASAVAYEKSGDPASAVLMYKKFLALSPKSPNAKEYSWHLGQLYEKLNQPAQAVSQYEANTVTFGDDLRNYQRLADLFLASKNNAGLIKVLGAGVRLSAAPASFGKILAQAYNTQGNTAQAADAYEAYLAKSPDDSTAWYELGSIYFVLNQYKKAIKPLRKAADLMPANAECHFRLGVSCMKSDSIAAAVTPLSKSFTLNPANTKVLLMLMQCYQQLKDTTNLISTLQKRIAAEKENIPLKLELGRLFLARGNTYEAISNLEAVCASNPSDVATHLLLADLYEKKGDKSARVSHLKAAFNLTPNDVTLNYQLARYYLDGGDAKSAETHLRKTIDLKPDHAQARVALAGVLKGRRDFSGALEQYAILVKGEPRNVQYLIDCAQVALLAGKTDLALATIEKALGMDKVNPQATVMAGKLYFEADQKEKAEPLLLMATQLDPGCAECNEYLGDIAVTRGETSKAVPYYEAAVAKDGRSDRALVKLANALGKDPKQVTKVEQMYDKARAINPGNGEAFYWLCATPILQGQMDKAEAVMRGAGSLSTSGWYRLAQALMEETKGNTDAAFLSYGVVLRLMPQNTGALMGMGRMCLEQGKFNDAIISFANALAAEPDNLDIYIGTGRAYVGLKDYTSAIEYFLEVTKKKPDHPEGFFYLGLAYSKKGDHLRALETLQKGIEINPKNGKLYLGLGHEQRGTNQYEEAVASYQKAMKNDKSLEQECVRAIGDVYYLGLKDEKSAEKWYSKYKEGGGKDPKVLDALTRMKGK